MADLDLSTKTILSICATTGAKVKDIPIQNGRMLFIHDRKRIAFDIEGKRTFYNQIEEIATDEERLSMSDPVVGSYYFVIDTAILWTYQERGWIPLTTAPEEILFIGTDVLPELGSAKKLYILKTGFISIWDVETQKYITVADKTESLDVKFIQNLFKN